MDGKEVPITEMEIYAWVVRDKEGAPRVLASGGALAELLGGQVPLVCQERETIEAARPAVRGIAARQDIPIYLMRFSAPQIVDTVVMREARVPRDLLEGPQTPDGKPAEGGG